MINKHKTKFENWAKERNEKVLTVCPVDPGLKAGQIVNVVNGYGYIIKGVEIIGFADRKDGKETVYLNWDCYWAAKDVKDILPAD